MKRMHQIFSFDSQMFLFAWEFEACEGLCKTATHFNWKLEVLVKWCKYLQWRWQLITTKPYTEMSFFSFQIVVSLVSNVFFGLPIF